MDNITNKLKIGILITLFITLFLLPAALAAVQAQNEDLTISVSYKNLEDDDDELSISSQITLTNLGSASENVTLALDGLSADYKLNLGQSNLQLSAGGSAEITISGKIPVDEDMGEHNIGNLKITDSSGQSSYPLKTDVASMLEMRRMTVKVNGNTEETTDETGAAIDHIEPGDEIELRFQPKNLFDSSFNEGDLDGTISAQLDQSGFGENIDDEQDFTVDAGETLSSTDQEIVFTFKVPLDVEDDEYTVDINFNAEDGNRANYEFDWELFLTVERKEDDLRIERLSVLPTEVSCTRTGKIVSDITNFGSNRQKHVYYTLQNDKLGLTQEYNFALEEGSNKENSETLSYDFSIDESQAAGIYTVVANLYYDYNQFVDRKTLDLVVKDCKTAPANTPAKNNETDVDSSEAAANKNTDASGGNKITSGVIARITEQPYSTSDVLVAVMVIAILIVLALIVLFVVILLRR